MPRAPSPSTRSRRDTRQWTGGRAAEVRSGTLRAQSSRKGSNHWTDLREQGSGEPARCPRSESSAGDPVAVAGVQQPPRAVAVRAPQTSFVTFRNWGPTTAGTRVLLLRLELCSQAGLARS